MSRVVVSAGPLRRLGAMLYDLLLVVAVLMVLTGIFLLFTHGESVTSVGGPLLYVYRVTMLLTYVGFFCFFWILKRQTLGMQAWRLCLVRLDGRSITARDALFRLAVASAPWLPAFVTFGVALHSNTRRTLLLAAAVLLALGPLNYFAAWFDPWRRSIHDRFLCTRIVRAG